MKSPESNRRRCVLPSRGRVTAPDILLPRTVAVLSACLVVLLASCTRSPREELPSEALEREGPDQESWQVDYYLREDGRDQLRIRAGYMAAYETPDSSYTLLTPTSDTSDVEVIWFDRSGERQGRLYAQKLYYYDGEQRLIAEGDVEAITVDQKRLETERLRWERETETIYAPGFARIITPTERIEGYDLVSDEQLEEYSLARVTGQVRIQEGSN